MADETFDEDKVLFVDDDESVLKALGRTLHNEPYQKLMAAGGKEALGFLERNDIAVIVTDLNMPEMSGIELLRTVQRKYPETVRVILTADAEVSSILKAIHSGETHRYLVKPWKPDEDLIPLIRQSLAYHHLMRSKRELMNKIVAQNIELSERNKEVTLMKEIIDQLDKNKTKKFSQTFKGLQSDLDFVLSELNLLTQENERTREAIFKIGDRIGEMCTLINRIILLLAMEENG